MEKVFKKLIVLADLKTNDKKDSLNFLLSTSNKSVDLLRLFYSNSIYNMSEKMLLKCVPKTTERYSDISEYVSRFSNKNKVFNNISFKTFKTLLDDIKNINSSNEKIEYFKNKVLEYDKITIMFIVRFLINDLKLGFSLKTVNKILGVLKIKKIENFSVQLCGKIKKLSELKFAKDDLIICEKFDGFRCVAKKEKGVVTLTSRQGKIINFMPEIIESLESIKIDNFVIDGEICGNTFNDIQQRIGKKNELKNVNGLKYVIFDVIKIENIKLQKEPLMVRKGFLKQFDNLNELLKIEKFFYYYDDKQVTTFFNDIIKKGGEGIIIKNKKSIYKYDDRKNWLKLKPIIENSFEIYDAKFGKGKNSKLISSLYVKDKKSNVKSAVGSGMTHENMIFATELFNENKLIGNIVEIKYNELTKNKKGEYSLRFPKFEKFRFDLNEADEVLKNV